MRKLIFRTDRKILDENHYSFFIADPVFLGFCRLIYGTKAKPFLFHRMRHFEFLVTFWDFSFLFNQGKTKIYKYDTCPKKASLNQFIVKALNEIL